MVHSGPIATVNEKSAVMCLSTFSKNASSLLMSWEVFATTRLQGHKCATKTMSAYYVIGWFRVIIKWAGDKNPWNNMLQAARVTDACLYCLLFTYFKCCKWKYEAVSASSNASSTTDTCHNRIGGQSHWTCHSHLLLSASSITGHSVLVIERVAHIREFA